LLVLKASTYGNNNTVLSTATVPTGGCSTAWVVPTASQKLGGVSTGAISDAYCLSSVAGATTVNITWNGSTPGGSTVQPWELSFTGSSVILDTGSSGGIGTVSNSATTTPPGVALTLSGTNDEIIQQINFAGGNATSITLYSNFVNGDFWASADLENTTNGAAPTWTESGAAVASIGNAIAFTEVSSGGSTFKTQVGGFLVGP
jgi:hypothetical protein